MSANNNQEQQPQPIVVERDDEKDNTLIVSNVQQNHAIDNELEALITILSLIELPQPSPLARNFAGEVEKNSKELVSTQSALRQCLQTVMKVESYKSSRMNDEQNDLWSCITSYRKEIRKAVINVNDVTIEWFGYLSLLQHGLVYFYESIVNGGTSDNAIAEFQSAAKSFCEFYKKNVSNFHAVRERSEKAMEEILDKFNGGAVIKKAFEARKQFAEVRQKHSEELKKLKQQKWKDLTTITQSIALLEGELAQHDVQLKFEKQQILNLEKEERNAIYRAKKNEEIAETKTNYERVERKTNILGWEIYGYYKDVYTGEHDRYKRVVSNYRNIRANTLNKKEARTKIIKIATQRKIESERKIKIKKDVFADVRRYYDERIKQKENDIKQEERQYEQAEKEIQDAIKKFCVNRYSISEFLQSTNALSQESLKALEVTKKVEVAIRNFSEIVSSHCRTVLRIDYYFRRDGVDLEEMIEPLKTNFIVTVGDLECDDEKEFNERVLPHIKDIANAQQIYKLKKISFDKNNIKKWKAKEKNLAKTNVQLLMNQIPLLAVFFPSLQDRLTLALKMINFKDAIYDNTETLKKIQIEGKQLQETDEKKRKMNMEQIEKINSKHKKKERRRKNSKKSKKKKRRKKKESSSESDSTSEDSTSEDESSQDESSEYESSDSDSTETESDDSDNYKNKKKNSKNKKNKKKDKNRRKKKDKNKKNKKKDKKRHRNRHYSSDSNNSETDSDASGDSDNYKNKKKKKHKMMRKEILLLEKVVDRNKAKCLNEGSYDKVSIRFDEDRWYKELQKLLKKGEKRGIDVKLEVSVYRKKYTINDAYLDKKQHENDENDDSDQKANCVFTLQGVDGNVADCMNNDYDIVKVNFDENKWGLRLTQALEERTEEEMIRLEVSCKRKKYTIIEILQ